MQTGYQIAVIMDALKYGNIDAAKLANALLYWHEALDSHPDRDCLYCHQELITIIFAIWKMIIHDAMRCLVSINIPLNRIESCALKNYWLDIRCLTAVYLLQSNKYNDHDTYRECVNALLNG